MMDDRILLRCFIDLLLLSEIVIKITCFNDTIGLIINERHSYLLASNMTLINNSQTKCGCSATIQLNVQLHAVFARIEKQPHASQYPVINSTSSFNHFSSIVASPSNP